MLSGMKPLTASASVTVDATPQQVYDVVSDITRTGEWSQVCRSAEWVDPAVTGEGAQFLGHNDDGARQWTTTSTVVSALPGEEFVWEVGQGNARWGYAMREVGGEAADDGTDGDGVGVEGAGGDGTGGDGTGGDAAGPERAGSGRTELTHTWEVLPALYGFLADKFGDQAESALAARADSAHASLPKTVAALKEIVEREG